MADCHVRQAIFIEAKEQQTRWHDLPGLQIGSTDGTGLTWVRDPRLELWPTTKPLCKSKRMGSPMSSTVKRGLFSILFSVGNICSRSGSLHLVVVHYEQHHSPSLWHFHFSTTIFTATSVQICATDSFNHHASITVSIRIRLCNSDSTLRRSTLKGAYRWIDGSVDHLKDASSRLKVGLSWWRIQVQERNGTAMSAWFSFFCVNIFVFVTTESRREAIVSF